MLDHRAPPAMLADEPMSTTDKPTTDPTDLLPAQIHEALCALGKRDGVTIHLCTYVDRPVTWQAIEARQNEDRAFESRSGSGATYDAALSACRAATFSGGGK